MDLMRKRYVILLIGIGSVALLIALVLSRPMPIQSRDIGKFGDVSGLAIDDVGNVYTADWLRKQIQTFDGNGTFLSGWGFSATAIVVDASGNLYSLERTERVIKSSNSGAVLQQWQVMNKGGSAHADDTDIALDSNGNVYTSHAYYGTLGKYRPDGQPVFQLGNEYFESINMTLYQPISIAIDNEDNLYVYDVSRVLKKFRILDSENTDSVCPQERLMAEDLCFTSEWKPTSGESLAVDSRGFVYITNHGEVKKYSNEGELLKVFDRITPSVSPAALSIGDIAIDKDDNVFVADSYCGWIVKYSSDGKQLTHWGETTIGGTNSSTSDGKTPCV